MSSPEIFRTKKSRILYRKLTSLTLAFCFLLQPMTAVRAEEMTNVGNHEGESVILEAPAGVDDATELIAEDESITDETEDSKNSDIVAAVSSASSSSPGFISPSQTMGATNEMTFPTVDLQNGAFTYSYQIEVPTGRNGLQPDLAIKYSSQGASDGGIVGYGWSLNIPSIERVNKRGFQQLYSDNNFNSSLDGELVFAGSDNYTAKVEQGSFMTYAINNNVWTVKDNEGTTSLVSG